jgi:NADH-quinone oxidoreductase subunit B
MGLVDDFQTDGLSALEHNVITGKVEDLVQWSRYRSACWPATFGLACCAIEMMAAGGAHYDLARYGMEVFRASPRQADLMIVAGRVSQKMAPILRQIYDQMMEPKWVISMGVCASWRHVQQLRARAGRRPGRARRRVRPGCPPGPETLMHAIETLHSSIKSGEIFRRRELAHGGARPGGAGIHLDTGVGAPTAPSPVEISPYAAPAVGQG